MKKTFYVLGILLWILFPGKASGQNDNYCYVRTRTMTKPNSWGYYDEISYYNAAGKVCQSYLKGYTPQQKNLFTCTEYDGLGRESRTWLPIYSAKDYLAANDLNSLASPQYGGESYCYERVSYNNSPLNRVAARYAPGSAWNVHPSTTEYLSNTASGVLACKRYEVGTSGGVTQSGNFASRTLRVTKTADEDGHSVYDFQDVDGKTVLVRRVSGNTYYDTYYVYDAYRRLRYVLQPGYQDEADLSLHAFCYTYDERGRCTELKKPGTGTIRYGYGNNDLMLFSQDEKQQAANLMTFYLYDKTHRLVVKGECEIPLNFAGAEQATICTYTGPGTGIDGCGYTANFNFPSPVLQFVNFYDDYSFRTGTGFNNTNFPAPVGNYSCGRKTGSIVYVPGQDTRLYKAYYYSMRGNLIREVSSNLRGGYDTTETTYSFTDRPSHSTHTHTAQNAPTLTETYDYTYDHADRLTKVEHTFGGVKRTLLAHAYDELCRLSHTDYHGSSANRLTYSYNLRGWLTGISGNKFSQNLYYNTGNGTPCYNGNISSMTWKAGNETTLRGYKFTYDGLNRMLDAVYGESTSISSNANRFTEKVTGYDKNGNILALQRYGQTGTSTYGLIDNLTFTLNGNQLNRVDDAVTASAYNNGFEFKDAVKQADEYAYDANGNLTKDLNKGISNISYNCLNLPSVVTFSDGSTITYTYAADGTKLRTVHTIGSTTTTTDYCGNVIYENGVQKLLLTEAGYVTLADSKYHYYLQDHQGNNRVVIDQNGTVEETNHYYPFGGLFANSTSVQPYKYNGKELDTKKGLNWYDYGARHYDAVLGRFATVDPSSESYYETSPYAYCGNNPVVRIDPTGADWIQDRYGSFLWDNNATNQETTRYGWTYIGAELPEDVNHYRILEEINGKLYHKHTQNIFASLINMLAGEKLLVEKKAYSPVEEQMMQQFLETGVDLAIGAGIGKAVGLAGKAIIKGGSKVGKGYSSFAAFKKAEGAAGDGMAWHHIVEQNADNIAKFGAEKIHNTQNLIRLPNGKGSIHAKISGYYSSKPNFTNGLTVREWLKNQSYKQQYEFGIKTLIEFGWKP